MDEPAKTLIMIGGVLVAIGLVIPGIHKAPFLGRLPGDILIKRENVTLYQKPR